MLLSRTDLILVDGVVSQGGVGHQRDVFILLRVPHTGLSPSAQPVIMEMIIKTRLMLILCLGPRYYKVANDEFPVLPHGSLQQ